MCKPLEVFDAIRVILPEEKNVNDAIALVSKDQCNEKSTDWIDGTVRPPLYSWRLLNQTTKNRFEYFAVLLEYACYYMFIRCVRYASKLVELEKE